MRYATRFIDDAQKLQREYYLGRIQRETAILMMGELMRYHNVIREDEVLVDIPDGFRSEPQSGFIGEFTVRQKDSPYVWKRSFARNMPPLPNSTNFFQAHYNADSSTTVRQHYTSPALRKAAAAREAFPPLTDKDREFFAPYEQQMTEHLVAGGRRVSARFEVKE